MTASGVANDQSLAPRRLGAGDLRVERVGDGHEIFIIDDFYQRPEQVREIALSLADWKTRRGFPGLEATIEMDTSALFAELTPLLGNGAISPHRMCDGRLVFSVMNTRESELYPASVQRPHFDTLADIAGLVYLNPPSQCRGGTAFYRHRRSGLDAWPRSITRQVELARALDLHSPSASPVVSQLALQQYLFDVNEDLGKGFITNSNAAWELSRLVEMRFNRAVFYRNNLFHAAYVGEEDFGEGWDARRLTQTIFLTERCSD